MELKAGVVFCDIETAGLNIKDPIIQIGAVAVSRKWEAVAEFEAKIAFDEKDADPEALKINCYDREVWKQFARPAHGVLAEFAGWLQPYCNVEKKGKKPPHRPYRVARLIGHSIRFDEERLASACRDLGIFLPAAIYEGLDTLALSRWVGAFNGMDGLENHKLPSLARWLEIPEETEAHDALVDCHLALQVTQRLLELLLRG